MRILVLCIDAVALCLTILASAAVVGSIALPVAGGGPAAIAAAILGVLEILAVAFALVSTALPLTVALALGLFSAFAAGYRYLRWARFAGCLAHFAGGAYFLWFFGPTGAGVGMAASLAVVGSLCLFIPRTPNFRLTRKMVAFAHPALFAAVSFPLAALAVKLVGDAPAAALVLLALLAATYILYHCNRKLSLAVPEAVFGRAFWKRFALSVGGSAAFSLLLPLLGLPMLLSCFLVLALAEMAFFYPSAPPTNAAHRVFVKYMGRAPEGAPRDAAATGVEPAGEGG